MPSGRLVERRWGQLSGEVEENQVVGGAFFQVFNPGFVGGSESFQEGAELGLGTFGAAGGAEFLPAFLEGGVLLGAEVAPAIAQQMHGAELVLGVGEQALEQAGQAAEVVGDPEQDAGEATVFEVDEHLTPVFQDFVAPEGGGGEDLFFAIHSNAQDQEMDGGFDLIMVVFEVDDFGVGEEAKPIRGQGAGEEILGLLVELFQELFSLFGRVAQAHGLEGAPRGGKALGSQEDVLEQLLITFR